VAGGSRFPHHNAPTIKSEPSGLIDTAERKAVHEVFENTQRAHGWRERRDGANAQDETRRLSTVWVIITATTLWTAV